MGILRSDVVSHSQLQPTGSVLLDGNSDYLSWSSHSSLKMGTSDFTLEAWVNITGNSDANLHQTIFMAGDSSDAGEMVFQVGANNAGTLGQGAARELQIRVAGTGYFSYYQIEYGQWYHVACVRDSGKIAFFVDGVHTGRTISLTENLTTAFTQIGYRDSGYNAYFNGYISNARIAFGALYKNNFTPSKFELENVAGTQLLCCQSSSSATEAYLPRFGGTLTANGTAAASSFVPDVKKDITDVGVVLGDNTKFDTLSYLVPPGGTTAESNRGRAVMAGGETPSNTTNMQYVQMQSDGNATKFGSLTTASRKQFSCASSTRGIFGSGYAPSGTNVIEYVTIATTSNVTDFGDIANDGQCQGCSNNTRGIIAGGYGNPADNVVSYLTIATAGNSSDFGDLTTGRFDIACLASSTRGLLPGGNAGAAANNTISYVTIASTGNDTDFGDSTSAFSAGSGVASSTRGGFALCTSQVNTIDYVTIASAGNAADFGDLTAGRSEIMNGGASNSIRGLFCGGQSPTIVNTIDYITIASTGNAKDFGDMNVTASATAAASDSHGGISE